MDPNQQQMVMDMLQKFQNQNQINRDPRLVAATNKHQDQTRETMVPISNGYV